MCSLNPLPHIRFSGAHRCRSRQNRPLLSPLSPVAVVARRGCQNWREKEHQQGQEQRSSFLIESRAFEAEGSAVVGSKRRSLRFNLAVFQFLRGALPAQRQSCVLGFDEGLKMLSEPNGETRSKSCETIPARLVRLSARFDRSTAMTEKLRPNQTARTFLCRLQPSRLLGCTGWCTRVGAGSLCSLNRPTLAADLSCRRFCVCRACGVWVGRVLQQSSGRYDR